MKLSDYAKKLGVNYKTVWRLWKAGHLDAFQLPTGTVIIKDERKELPDRVCIYARVSSSENKSNLYKQAERLKDYSIARGYQIYKVVEEIGSGINDNRKKLNKILGDRNYNKLVIEHKDRLTRFGFNYIQILFKQIGKEIEIVNEAGNDKQDLIQDFISIITSFCARIYGLRRGKRKIERIIKELQDEENSRV